MSDLGHHELEELLGAYALDAVDADERALIELHLQSCPRCRAEVAEHREVAAFLAQSGAPAPDGLWDRIAAALEEPPPQLRLSLMTPAPPIANRPWLSVRNLSIAAAILVIAALVATLGFAVADQHDRIQRLQQDRDLAAAADSAFADPRARTAELRSADGDVQAIAVVRPNGEGYFVARDLPSLDGRIYQLWGVSGETAISLGVLGSDPRVIGFSASGPFDQLAVTAEDRPVVSSSNTPVVAGALT
jgi:anti-sigma factor RsiW